METYEICIEVMDEHGSKVYFIRAQIKKENKRMFICDQIDFIVCNYDKIYEIKITVDSL
jgi:uncharacterized pyridoxamine 5'-phosphate oxidase family protein